MPTTADDLDGAMTPAQAAERLGVSLRTVQRLIAENEIGYFRTGFGRGRIKIPLRAVTDYLTRRTELAGAVRRHPSAARMRGQR